MDVTGNIDTRNAESTTREVRRIYESLFGQALFGRVEEAAMGIALLFAGKFPAYQRCDTTYHDLEHTLQVFLAAARIFDGLVRADGSSMSMRYVTLGLISALGHDTGFIKAVGDDLGRGGKYTLTHVERSKQFMAGLLHTLGFDAADVLSVNNIISCTGLNVNISAIPFSSAMEREAACVVGSADYLGQMSDPRYIEKLPWLYQEYSEGGVAGYTSADDLIKNTPRFFDEFVMGRLKKEFGGVYKFAAVHFGGRDLYLQGIRKNVGQVGGDSGGRPSI